MLQAQEEARDDELRRIIRENQQAEVEIPFPGRGELKRISSDFSISSVDEKKVSIRLSPLTADLFISRNYDYSMAGLPARKGILSSASFGEALSWNVYPTYLQYDSIMRSFQSRFPELCHLDTIGLTNYGKQVLVLKISDNHGADEDEPEVFYTSSMHGDETGGFILMLRLCDYILANYSTSSRIRNLVDNLEIWINPLANPDGMYRTGNLMSNPTRFNAYGYDLNRNFPDPLVASVTLQKETVDMMKFLAERRFVLSANFHSGSEVVNYPWDRWLEKKHADDLWFYLISRAYADTVHAWATPGYMTELDNGVTRGAVWYVITGGRQDYVTWDLRGREVTIELDNDFITPVSQLESLWQWNYRSLLSYIENALFGIHGHVEDALTGNPVPAVISIPGYDKDNSQVYSDSLTGRYTRLLNPQAWTLKFSAAGYLDTTIYNIPVFAGQRTLLDVRMVPLVNAIDTTNPVEPVLYPNPASEYIKAVLPESFYGPLNIRIYSVTGILVSDSESETQLGLPVTIDVGHLPAGSYSAAFRSRISGISVSARFIVLH
ncbi:MAG: hypothetical protein MUD02_01520 [Bacteroidales bacterium]|nr:hypothetical protein [Bacteroidales bacterium]